MVATVRKLIRSLGGAATSDQICDSLRQQGVTNDFLSNHFPMDGVIVSLPPFRDEAPNFPIKVESNSACEQVGWPRTVEQFRDERTDSPMFKALLSNPPVVPNPIGDLECDDAASSLPDLDVCEVASSSSLELSSVSLVPPKPPAAQPARSWQRWLDRDHFTRSMQELDATYRGGTSPALSLTTPPPLEREERSSQVAAPAVSASASASGSRWPPLEIDTLPIVPHGDHPIGEGFPMRPADYGLELNWGMAPSFHPAHSEFPVTCKTLFMEELQPFADRYMT